MTDKDDAAGCAGVLLAGGKARRMGGGDKCLRPLAGKPLLAHVLERVRSQVGPLLLNSNSDPANFADYDLPVKADVVGDFAGPLAGVLTGMDWAAEAAPEATWLASFATDAPFLPHDLVARMREAVESGGAVMACAKSHGRRHPVFGLWPMAYREQLRRAMLEEEIRKVDRWTGRYHLVEVAFPDEELPGGAVDPLLQHQPPRRPGQGRGLFDR